MFHLKSQHIPSHDSYSQHLHLAVPLQVQQAYLYLLHDTRVGQVKVLGIILGIIMAAPFYLWL